MKRLFLFFLCFCALQLYAQTRIDFNTFFLDQTLRIDYYHSGNATEEYLTLDRIYGQGIWAGNPGNLLQNYDMGKYSAKVYDLASNTLIFSTGYSTTFSEYQTTGPALDGVRRTYHETVLIPRPKNKFLFVIEKRDKYNLLYPIFREEIDPNDYHIIVESQKRPNDEIIPVVKNADPHKSVDLVIIGEGYAEGEQKIFKKDLDYFTGIFFSIEPYASRHAKFNITGIYAPSGESGTDEPRQGRYRNTVLGSSFNTFDSDRYLLADDNKTLRDIAAQVPYDAVLVMVNLDRYGGGGIFNWQTVFATGSPQRDYVFLHEFGHAFAGLADEYYTSDVSYEDFYPAGIEPTDPNVTALLDPQNLKWKDLVSPGLAIPTEWGKPVFDSLNHSLKLLTKEKADTLQTLQKSGASSNEITKTESSFDSRIVVLRAQIDSFLFNHPLKGKIGAFEGAGYQSKGLYRPTVNSMMHRFDPGRRSFEAVNERAIKKMIDYYTE
jgi:IgA Peptidase M64/Peptidase M64 N-terminus